jgi:hypothetical protein
LPNVGKLPGITLPVGLQPQRFRYPFRNSREKLASFAASVDALIEDHHLTDSHAQDDFSFERPYDSLAQILLSAADPTFELPSPRTSSPRLRSPTIRLLVRETRRIGHLIFAAKTGPLTLDRLCARTNI